MKKYSNSNLIAFIITLGVIFFFVKIHFEVLAKDKTVVKPKQIKSNIYENKKYMIRYMKIVNYRMYPELSTLIYSSIIRASREYNVDSVMLFSIINQESRFNPWAISEANCIGLGQVNWNIWEKILTKEGLAKEKINLYSPKINIFCSAFIFKKKIKMSKGNISQALRRYFGLLKSGERSDYDIKVLKKRKAYIKYVKDRRKGEKR